MRNRIIIISLSWFLVILTMIIIFNFSTEDAATSTQTSAGVVTDVLGVVMDKDDITPKVVEKFQLPFRKVAHFCIYMLLGFCVISAYEKSFKINFWLNCALSLVFCFAYAVTDEIHQSFSAGRAPTPIDALIDTSGAIIGIGVFVGFISLYRFIIKIRSRSN